MKSKPFEVVVDLKIGDRVLRTYLWRFTAKKTTKRLVKSQPAASR